MKKFVEKYGPCGDSDEVQSGELAPAGNGGQPEEEGQSGEVDPAGNGGQSEEEGQSGELDPAGNEVQPSKEEAQSGELAPAGNDDQSEKDDQGGDEDQPGGAIQPAEENQAVIEASVLETFATLKLPEQFPKGYPVRFGVLEFTTSAELLLNLPNDSIGKLLAAATNRSMSVPMGASYLNVKIAQKNLDYYQIYPGKSGGGMNWEELQQAILAGQVTHVVQCVISNVRYADEYAGKNLEGYGISVSQTTYRLDLNVVVYDLSRQKVVLGETYVGTKTERHPFSQEAFVNDIFHFLLDNACQQAADGITAAASRQRDGSEPKILPVY